MFSKANGVIGVIILGLGVGIGYWLFHKPVTPPPPPMATSGKSTTRKFDPATGKVSEEVVVESTSTPVPNPKPRYKVTLIPSYEFLTGRINYSGLYEKRYDLPLIGDCYLGIYASSKLEAGVSISKEFQ